jgi:hypothetical protein
MVTRLVIPGLADPVEVFCVPDDYPEFETEDGSKLPQGHWWWYLSAACEPDGYPVGPFDTGEEAQRDAMASAASEP